MVRKIVHLGGLLYHVQIACRLASGASTERVVLAILICTPTPTLSTGTALRPSPRCGGSPTMLALVVLVGLMLGEAGRTLNTDVTCAAATVGMAVGGWIFELRRSGAVAATADLLPRLTGQSLCVRRPLRCGRPQKSRQSFAVPVQSDERG